MQQNDHRQQSRSARFEAKVLGLAVLTAAVLTLAGCGSVPAAHTATTPPASAPSTVAGSVTTSADSLPISSTSSPAATEPPAEATTEPSAPAAAASGHFSGGDQTLTVSFDSDGKTVSNFSAHGGWYCYPQGEQVMAFSIPQSFPVGADGTFAGTVSGTVSGINMTWTVNGTITGAGTATGGLTVASDNYCKLYPTNWSVAR